MKILPFLLLPAFIPPAFSQSIMWSRQIGDSTDQILTSFQVDGSGSRILFGKYRTYPETGAMPYSQYRIESLFLHKLDSTGVTVWFRHLGSPYGYDEALDMDIDEAGNIYVLGSMGRQKGCLSAIGGCVLSSAGSATVLLDSAGSETFLARFSPAGKVEWVRQFTRNTNFRLTLNPSMNLGRKRIFVYGMFRSALGVLGEAATLPGGGEDRGFLAAFNADGTHPVLTVFDSSAYLALAEEDSRGNLYLGHRTLDGKAVLEKSDSLGRPLWSKVLLTGSSAYLDKLFWDDAGNLYVTGGFQFSASFLLDDGRDSLIETENGSASGYFLKRLHADGRTAWLSAGKKSSGVSSGAMAPDGGLYYCSPFENFMIKVDAAGIARQTSVPFMRFFQVEPGGSLAAARSLSGSTTLFGKPFTSVGKLDFLVLKVDMTTPTGTRRAVDAPRRFSGSSRYSPLGRLHSPRDKAGTGPIRLYP